ACRPLHVDELGWDAAHDARRHHRLVGERDAAGVCPEGLGDRDREVACHVARLAEAEIYDQVPDHAPCSRFTPDGAPPGVAFRRSGAAVALIGIKSAARVPMRGQACYFLLPSALNWLT